MTVSARQQFGQILKDLRRDKHLTQKELATLLGYTEQYVRHIEAGRKSPPPDLGTKAAPALGIPTFVLERLCRDARTDGTPLGHYSDHERAATGIRIWENRMIPGLLQTEDYIREIIHDEDAISFRLARQKILPNTALRVVVGESVLLHQIGSAAQFRTQLMRLIDFQVQVIPARNYHTGIEGPLTIMNLPDGAAIVWIDGQPLRPGTILDTDEAIKTAMRVWEDVLCCALPPDISGEMIAAIADDLPEGP